MKIYIELKNGVTKILDNEWDEGKIKKEFEEKDGKSFDDEVLNIIFTKTKDCILWNGYSLKDIKCLKFE